MLILCSFLYLVVFSTSRLLSCLRDSAICSFFMTLQLCVQFCSTLEPSVTAGSLNIVYALNSNEFPTLGLTVNWFFFFNVFQKPCTAPMVVMLNPKP